VGVCVFGDFVPVFQTFLLNEMICSSPACSSGGLGVHRFSHCDLTDLNYTWFISPFWYLNCGAVLFQGVIDGTDYGHNFATKSQSVLQQQEQAIYPERPGELECPHYMKHGYCKFQMNCKFHHPRDRLPKK